MTDHSNLPSIISGVLLSVTASVAGWIGNHAAASHMVEVFAFGVLGGVGGWCGRVMVTTTVERLRQRKINKQNNNNNQG